MIWTAKWIKSSLDTSQGLSPLYYKEFDLNTSVKKAKMYVTALGCYEVSLNGEKVGNYVFAPGWTSYLKRLQYQEYDVTHMLKNNNRIEVIVGRGWYHTRMPGFPITEERYMMSQGILEKRPFGLLGQLEITLEDDTCVTIATDENWSVCESPVRFSDIYHGEIYDATYKIEKKESAEEFEGPWDTLISQEGPIIREQERIAVRESFITPKGEVVFDFGQNITGYVEFDVEAKEGEIIDISFAEVMDKEGNFYTDNYRGSKCICRYICKEGKQKFSPGHTFYGFRYIRVNSFPSGITSATAENFTAVAVHSEMKRTGYLSSSNGHLNQFFQNVLWGQKCNFLDVPTDCPQRDERLGWTGDILVFIKAACLNYDVEGFFKKWLGDLKEEQLEDGYVPHMVPDVKHAEKASAAWGDAAVVVPWEIYLAYGNKEILENQYDSMCAWISYITTTTTHKNLWVGGQHFGDWLALDADPGQNRGASRDDFVASAFYAYSTSLVIKTGKVLDRDVSEYEELYKNIVSEFRKVYPTYTTQTECVLAAHFGLAEKPEEAAAQLAERIKKAGNKLETGFVGTPYLLHTLSEFGYNDLAYTLILYEGYPSWLYQVTKGATTIWEHWNGIAEDGSFWDPFMNSFNHYAYGSIIDWVYTVAAGIQTKTDYPGYEKVIIAPKADTRMEWLNAALETRHGLICSEWRKQEGAWRFDITTPVEAEIIIGDKHYNVSAGSYCFYDKF